MTTSSIGPELQARTAVARHRYRLSRSAPSYQPDAKAGSRQVERCGEESSDDAVRFTWKPSQIHTVQPERWLSDGRHGREQSGKTTLVLESLVPALRARLAD